MDVSRRSFLRGALAITAIAVVQPALAFASIPTIHGDGIHDDADGLNAMFAGEPFRIEGGTFRASDGRLIGGNFGIKRPVLINSSHWQVMRCNILALPGFEGDHMLRLGPDANWGGLTDMHLDGRNMPGWLIGARYDRRAFGPIAA